MTKLPQVSEGRREPHLENTTTRELAHATKAAPPPDSFVHEHTATAGERLSAFDWTI